MPASRDIAGRYEIDVQLAAAPYRVVVGEDLLGQTGALLQEHAPPLGSRCALLSDSHVAPLFGDRVAASLRKAGFEPIHLVVPAGEVSKSMEETSRPCRDMLRAGLDRTSFVVALGGGVVGDLAGFCAAIFQRGVPCIQLPTTIVSQVDSSVGGKTGVNTPEGKNLLGAFHQPALVVADVDTLRTLPPREYAEGFAEIIKHAAIRDPGMLDEVAGFHEDPQGISPLIARNVEIKAAIVEADERERSGTRALLNFGHTVGHAIEAAAGYGELLHGEAISLGLLAALRLSESVAGLAPAESRAVIDALHALELPQTLPEGMSEDAVLRCMERDKKFVEGRIRFVLLRELGDAFVSSEVTREQIREQVDRLRHEP